MPIPMFALFGLPTIDSFGRDDAVSGLTYILVAWFVVPLIICCLLAAKNGVCKIIGCVLLLFYGVFVAERFLEALTIWVIGPSLLVGALARGFIKGISGKD